MCDRDDEGAEVTATWGPETHCPVKYHAIVVGPFSATRKVRAGETIAEALRALSGELASLAQEELDRRIPAHVERAREGRK
jgi:hypothetical protein